MTTLWTLIHLEISLTDHEEHEKAEKKTQAKKKKSKHRHHHKAHFTQDELELRRTKGSELAMEDIDAIKKMGDSSDEDLDGKYFLKIKISKKIGILLPKLFRPTVRKNSSSEIIIEIGKNYWHLETCRKN